MRRSLVVVLVALLAPFPFLLSADSPVDDHGAAPRTEWSAPIRVPTEPVLASHAHEVHVAVFLYAAALDAAAKAEAAKHVASSGGGGGGHCAGRPNHGGEPGSVLGSQQATPGGPPQHVVDRESNGYLNTCNRASGACGKYQVLASTWDGYAGYGSACDAPEAVQDQWAQEAYAARGCDPWVTC